MTIIIITIIMLLIFIMCIIIVGIIPTEPSRIVVEPSADPEPPPLHEFGCNLRGRCANHGLLRDGLRSGYLLPEQAN